MTLTFIIPVVAAVMAVIFMLIYGLKSDNTRLNYIWIIPATLSFLFTILTIIATIKGGSTGFWSEHIRNFWGNQIWCDLLLAISIAWLFIVPRAKKVEMKILFWMIFIILTGCIGFTAMVSRLLFLEEKSAKSN